MTKKNASDEVKVLARNLVPGNMVRANDGGLYRVISVDLVIDPRGGVYEAETDEVLVRLERESVIGQELMRGEVTIEAA